MTMFIIQSALLLAIAFIIGAIIGCLLHRFLGSGGTGAKSGARTEASAKPSTAGESPVKATPAAKAAAPSASAPAPANVRTTSLAQDAPVYTAPVARPSAAASASNSTPSALMSGAAPAAAGAIRNAGKPDDSAKGAKQEKAAKAETTDKAGKAEKSAKPPKKSDAASARDDIKLIVGIGRTNEAALNGMGIFTFAQIAEWSKVQQKEIGEKLAFPGRIEREQWVKQARSLMTGKNPIAKGAFKSGKKS